MSSAALLDNDVVLKICRYDLNDEAVACLTINEEPPCALAVCRYVLAGRISRSTSIDRKDEVLRSLADMVQRLRLTEPTDQELELASELEAAAQRQALELDTGESLLLAILLCRNDRVLITGDKRAIRSMEKLPSAEAAVGRVACFEQLILSLLGAIGLAGLRPKICRSSTADRAIAICFSCNSTQVSVQSVIDGLTSYLRDLQSGARTVMVPSADLSAVIS